MGFKEVAIDAAMNEWRWSAYKIMQFVIKVVVKSTKHCFMIPIPRWDVINIKDELSQNFKLIKTYEGSQPPLHFNCKIFIKLKMLIRRKSVMWGRVGFTG